MNKGSLRLIAVLCICTFTQCVPLSEFYPFGSGTTDVAVPYGDDGNSGKIVLGYQLPYLGSFYDSLYVSNIIELQH